MPNISVIQILRKEKLENNLNYKKVISENFNFLKSVNVEYIVYDNLKSFEILEFIKNYDIKYFRKDFKNTKTSMLESGMLADGIKLIYLKSNDILNFENVEQLEKIRPNLMKKDLKKVGNLKQENFSYDDFNLLIKDNKTIFEKVKIILSRFVW